MRIATVNITYRTADGIEMEKSEGLSDATPFEFQYPERIKRVFNRKFSKWEIQNWDSIVLHDELKYNFREYQMISKRQYEPGPSPIIDIVYEEVYPN